jgi:16S rRNA (uracil1498-N3)-methyltransferase
MNETSGTAELDADEAHHLNHVLRLSQGDVVRVFDGAGREWEGAVVAATRHGATVSLGRVVDAVRESPVAVTLAVGLLKGDQMETVVREATALGVAAIVPLVTERVVSPGRARVDAARERWRRVAIASAKQCGRAVIPDVTESFKLESVLGQAGYDTRLILAEPETGAAASTVPHSKPESSSRPRILLLVGPEGGWTADEVRTALANGCTAWRLGPRTLKAELAPTVALAALWAAWGWE